MRDVYWPYETAPTPVHGKGDWRLGMTGGGSVVLWPSNKSYPAAKDEQGRSLELITVCEGERGVLEQFFITFCRQGWETDARHEYQDGKVWLFNWVSGSLAQVYIASQIVDLLGQSMRAEDAETRQRFYDEAWAVGRAFATAIRDAETKEHENA